MRNLLAIFCVSALSLFGQANNPATNVMVDQAGSCSPSGITVYNPNTLRTFRCNFGTWTQMASGGAVLDFLDLSLATKVTPFSIVNANQSGSCSNVNVSVQNSNNGNIYTCISGAWAQVNGTGGGGGGGIGSLNGLTGSSQTFTNDTNVTIVSGGMSHVITWSGTLAKARLLGTVVYTDQTNTYSTGVQDFSGATHLKIPTVPGYTPTMNGHFGYDSTSNVFKGYNGSIRTFAFIDSTFPESQITNLVSDLALKAPLASPAFTGNVSISGGFTAQSATGSTRPFASGASLPGTCSVGDFYDLTSASPGANIYKCTSTNAWTVETGGGTGAGSLPFTATFTGTTVTYTNTSDHHQGVHPFVYLYDSGGNNSTPPFHCKTAGGATVACSDSTSNGDMVIGPVISGTYGVAIYGGTGGPANPMSAAGDVIIGGTSGVEQRLAKGADNSVFTIDPTSHLPSWNAPGGILPYGLGFQSVSFSATPTFNAATVNVFKITLTANVTSSTLSGALAGQPLTMIICQDATGGRTFAWPSNMTGTITIGTTASKCSSQMFTYDGTTAYAGTIGVLNQ